MTEILNNPLAAGLFGALFSVGLLFGVGAVANFLHSRLAKPFRLPGRQDPSPLDDDQLITALQETVRRLRKRFFRPEVEDLFIPRQIPPLPASEHDVVAAETLLGRRFPPLLRRLYLEVANGGFGPAYGLIGVSGSALDSLGDNVATAYDAWRRASDELWNWPSGVLPLMELGCAAWLCIDLNAPELPVVELVPDDDPKDEDHPALLFRPFAPSLNQLLGQWVQGAPIFGRQR